jgi:hypothetical protein
MNVNECRREAEVTEVVASGRWPERCPEDIRAHVAGCFICADIVEVALTLREDYEAAMVQAQVPPPGLVWWRAELRARQEAMRTVSRPMTIVQAFGLACAAGVLVAVFSPLWPWLTEQLRLRGSIDMTSFSPILAQWGIPLALAVALALIIAAPIAMYLVLSDE